MAAVFRSLNLCLRQRKVQFPLSQLYLSSRLSFSSKAMSEDKPVENAVRKKLTEALKPQFLDVINESYMHNVPKGTESHFKVVIVSSAFENVKRIQSCSVGFIAKTGTLMNYLVFWLTEKNQWIESHLSGSPADENKHQLVHKAIQEEIDNKIHALSIVAKTPAEWEASQDVGKSPPCRGGAGL